MSETGDGDDTAPIWRISVTVPEAAADLMETALSGEGVTTSLFTVADDPEALAPDWLVEAFWPQEPDRSELTARVAAVAVAAGLGVLPAMEIELLKPRDWVAESEAAHVPVAAGRFFVHGPHDTDKIPEDKIGIEIPAAQAFGTGGHETTHGCLLALQEVMVTKARNAPLPAVLDLGTGSGILAISLALGYDQPVLASDIDPQAVAWAARNAEANGVASLLSAVAATGFENDKIRAAAPYDLILANILANPLIELADDMAGYLKPDGQLILAGLLVSQAEDVLAAYGAVGFRLNARQDKGDWAILTLNF